MYFDASERIAHKTSYPRSQIEKIDNFLAGQDIKRFELRQLQEKTELYTDVSPILEAYIRERVLSKETVYLCPEHLIALEPANRNEGRCTDCDRVYPFEDCPKKLIFERKREPERKKATNDKVVPQTTPKDKPWWKDARFVIGSIIVVIIAAIISLIGSILGSDTINIIYPMREMTIESTQDLNLDLGVDVTVTMDGISLTQAVPTVETIVATSEAVGVGVEETAEINIRVQETSLPVATPEVAGTP